MSELPKGHTILSKDDRLIHAVYWPAENGGGFTVGQCNVTRLEAYDERGSMSHVPWIAVFCGDEIYARVPADQVSIYYRAAP